MGTSEPIFVTDVVFFSFFTPLSRLHHTRPCGPPSPPGEGLKALNNNLPYETETLLRMAEMAPFSSRETWAWEMPSTLATSIWVLPS